jgi:hypothetical protein
MRGSRGGLARNKEKIPCWNLVSNLSSDTMKHFRGRKLVDGNASPLSGGRLRVIYGEEQPLTSVYRKTTPAANPSLLPYTS